MLINCKINIVIFIFIKKLLGGNMRKKIINCGIIGIIAIIITIISDFFLIGVANSSYSFFKLGTESMANIPKWRITLGTFLGIISIPFQGLGLVPLYYSFKNGEKRKAIVMISLLTHASFLAVGFHISYAFIAGGWNLFYKIGKTNEFAIELMKRFDYLWRISLLIMGIEFIIASLIFVFSVLNTKTLYPRWMAICNPVFILIFTFLIIYPIPYPLGGYLAPAMLNISSLIFMGTVHKQIQHFGEEK